MASIAVSKSIDDLNTIGSQRTLTGSSLSEVAFPLGGIGTGTISLGGRGNLRDFEIRNHPDKERYVPFSFFALWAKPVVGDPSALVLEGKIPPPYRDGGGEQPGKVAGWPRFQNVSFVGEYPSATLCLSDPRMPVTAKLAAWNPFIPLNVHDSAIPTAIFEWTITNDGDSPVKISLAASTSNSAEAPDAAGRLTGAGSTNEPKQTDALRGLFFSHPKADPNVPTTGTLALATSWPSTQVVPTWFRGGWFDQCHMFWDSFAATGKAPQYDYSGTFQHGETGSLIMSAEIPARSAITIPVVMTWHYPHVANPWVEGAVGAPETLDTYVHGRYENAWSVAEYVLSELPRLTEETHRWSSAIFSSTLPDYLLEAITSQASIMRTNTCYLLSDGRFFGWEGQWKEGGSCHGSCTHVWNYEQAVAFLFPQLERTMRQTEFLHNTRPSGNMAFRTNLPPGYKLWDFKPCVDGQMGTIIQVYRDWQLSGDDAFLKQLWPHVKLALEYAWTMTPDRMATVGSAPIGSPTNETRSIDSLWDPDKDGLMEGEQHNTYDIEFYGPNTLCSVMYLGALKACETMALYLGEEEKAAEYRAVYESGRAKIDEQLWNGEYYVQKIIVIPEVSVPEVLKAPTSGDDEAIVPKYQYGEGCLSDQLLGQWAAHVAGLGYLVDKSHVRSAVNSIFRYNYRDKIGDDANVQRVYALNDEPGLLLCSWPHGNRPALPFVYSDEVWTGIEYHVAAHLIYEGLVNEGLTIVKAVAERYEGSNRNPWNQIECGFHYARAMASWSVKLALDGFEFSAPEKRLGFAPKINAENYRTFWSAGSAWGIYQQNLSKNTFTLKVQYGTLELQTLKLQDLKGVAKARGPHGDLSVINTDGAIRLTEPITLKAFEGITLQA